MSRSNTSAFLLLSLLGCAADILADSVPTSQPSLASTESSSSDKTSLSGAVIDVVLSYACVLAAFALFGCLFYSLRGGSSSQAGERGDQVKNDEVRERLLEGDSGSSLSQYSGRMFDDGEAQREAQVSVASNQC
ncbi:MAG: hypothetical protein V4496_06925 [Pseudomonadota bacterium]